MARRKNVVDENQLSLEYKGFIFCEPPVRWTDEQIEDVRYEVLKDAIQTLMDNRSGNKSRQEVIDWIKSDETLPFSFVVCAKAEGCCPGELRDQILGQYEYKEKLKTKGVAEKQNAKAQPVDCSEIEDEWDELFEAYIELEAQHVA